MKDLLSSSLPIYSGPSGKVSFITWKNDIHILLCGLHAAEALKPSSPLPDDISPSELRHTKEKRLKKEGEVLAILNKTLALPIKNQIKFLPTSVLYGDPTCRSQEARSP